MARTLQKIVRKTRARKTRARKTRARKTRARKTRARKTKTRKTRIKKTKSRKAGMDPSPSENSRSTRHANAAIKKAAEQEKQKILLEVAAIENAKKNAKRKAAASAAAASAAAASAAAAATKASTRPHPYSRSNRPKQQNWQSMDDPKVISSIWNKHFEIPLKEVAENTKRKGIELGYSERRINHEIHLAVLKKYKVIFAKEKIHGRADYYLQRELASKYYKGEPLAILIRYYSKLMEKGKPIPQKAKTRLQNFLLPENSIIWNELTHPEQQALLAIVNSPAYPNEEDAHIVTDADLALHDLLYPNYDGPELTDEDLLS